jgi:hypothetical protein
VLEEAEVVAVCVVETVDRHRAPSIDPLGGTPSPSRGALGSERPPR